MDATLSSRAGRNCTVVEVRGVLDLTAEPAFREILQQAIDAGARRIVVDLAEVRLMDSSALGTLVLVFKALREEGGSLAVAAPRPLVRNVLEITSLNRVIGVYDTVQAAEDDGSAG